MKDMLSEVLTFLRYQDNYSEKEQAFIRKEMMKECDDMLAELKKMRRNENKGGDYFGRSMEITNGSPDEDI